MQPPSKETMICYCNDLRLGDIAEYIKANGIERYEELIEDGSFSCGNSCESCHIDGYNNDGLSLAMVVGMVKRGYI